MREGGVSTPSGSTWKWVHVEMQLLPFAFVCSRGISPFVFRDPGRVGRGMGRVFSGAGPEDGLTHSVPSVSRAVRLLAFRCVTWSCPSVPKLAAVVMLLNRVWH